MVVGSSATYSWTNITFITLATLCCFPVLDIVTVAGQCDITLCWMIADCFHLLLSALKQTHSPLVMCDSERVANLYNRVLNIH